MSRQTPFDIVVISSTKVITGSIARSATSRY